MHKQIFTIAPDPRCVFLYKGKYIVYYNSTLVYEVKYDRIYAFAPEINTIFRCTGEINITHFIPNNIIIRYM